MAIIKCKMCGGDMTLNEDKTLGMCNYCGSTMTLPKVSDEQRAARFNRGNHFRRQGEFDKAIAVYESIVREDDTDAEAHWCCALCRFGIEYVEDPNTYEYLPTCHRASFDSFLEDVDYKAALENSDGITRRQYQKDAAKIAEVQRGILATSQNEEPFDVFICYKETDDQTKERTRDSIDAQEIYYQLIQEGYRVFFARITLEDKAGTEYEPYIFAALNSAKVMVAIGSRPEYFNAVWVKNEWSRFLAIMRKDRSKLLLPCYKNMDPYDLPEQLGVLQSYDMTKIGFMQDLIRGIKKMLRKDEPRPEQRTPQPVVQQVVQTGGGPSTANLLRRGSIFLEEKNWASAEEYFNKVLDIEAENGDAYLGLALAKANCSNPEDFIRKLSDQYNDEPTEMLAAGKPETERIEAAVERFNVPGYLEAEELRKPFEFPLTYPSRETAAVRNKARTLDLLKNNRNYARARQYAAPTLKAKLDAVEKRISEACEQRIEQAKEAAAAEKSEVLKRYQAHLAKQEKAAEERSHTALEQREEAYLTACRQQANAKTKVEFSSAAADFDALKGYQDADILAAQCREAAETAAKEAAYQAACELQTNAEWEEKLRTAAKSFRALQGFRDSDVRAMACEERADILKREAERRERRRTKKKKIITIAAVAAAVLLIPACYLITNVIIPNGKYNAALKLYEDGRYEEAITGFEALNGYKDSAEQIEKCDTAIKDGEYDAAVELYNAGMYDEAIAAFQALDGYKDSTEQIAKCETAIKDEEYAVAVALIDSGDYEAAYILLDGLNYKDSESKRESIKGQYLKAVNSRATVGSYIVLGAYEQDNQTSNGKEDIEWLVLDKNGTKLLVISRYVLDWKPYNNVETNTVTWSSCSLRNWLNGPFITLAFNSEEQKMIVNTAVVNEKGNDTKDKVFLLSTSEKRNYFSGKDSGCQATEYTKAQGAKSTNCRWWLRSIDYQHDTFACYADSGYGGTHIIDGSIGVRPVLWIDLG